MGVVNLSKNQVVNLSKSAEGLKQVVVGLGWDEAKASGEKKGLFGRIFGSSSSGSTQSIDCDAFAVMLESNDRLASKDDVIFYGNLHAKGGSVYHTGDNLTGEGDGDDEQITINLPAVNSTSWDEAKASGEKKGLFGRIFGSSSSGSTQSIDCDAFAVMLESNDRLASKDDVIFYGNLHAKGGSVYHTGDNLTGEGDGDDEQITINLPAVNSRITKIIIGVCIFRGTEKGQDFSKIENAFVRIVNSNNNQEMCRYNLSGKEYGGYTTMKFGELYRESDGSWAFRACGEPDRADSIRSYTGNFR